MGGSFVGALLLGGGLLAGSVALPTVGTRMLVPAGVATATGALLLLLCTVQFLDVLDASILNVAHPSIEKDLHFTQQSLQWVVSGYVLTYGGFLLLGGRLAVLLGRRLRHRTR